MINYESIDNRTMQAGRYHSFEITFFDIYGNDISNIDNFEPPFYVLFKDQSGLLKV